MEERPAVEQQLEVFSEIGASMEAAREMEEQGRTDRNEIVEAAGRAQERFREELASVAEHPERAYRRVEQLYEREGLEGVMTRLAEEPEEVIELKSEDFFGGGVEEQMQRRAREAFRPAGDHLAHQAAAGYALSREHANLANLAKARGREREARERLEARFEEVYKDPQEAMRRLEARRERAGYVEPDLFEEAPERLGELAGEQVGSADSYDRQVARARAEDLPEHLRAHEDAQAGVEQMRGYTREAGPTLEAMKERFGSTVGVIESGHAHEVLAHWDEGRKARRSEGEPLDLTDRDALQTDEARERVSARIKEGYAQNENFGAERGDDYLRREIDHVARSQQARDGDLENLPSLQNQDAQVEGAEDRRARVAARAEEVWRRGSLWDRQRIEQAVEETRLGRVPGKVEVAASVESNAYTQWHRAQQKKAQQKNAEQQREKNARAQDSPEEVSREDVAGEEPARPVQPGRDREEPPEVRREREGRGENRETDQGLSEEDARAEDQTEQRRVGQEPGGAVESVSRRVSSDEAPGLEDRTRDENGQGESVGNERVMEPQNDEQTSDMVATSATESHRSATTEGREAYARMLAGVAERTQGSRIDSEDVKKGRADPGHIGAYTEHLHVRASEEDRRLIEEGVRELGGQQRESGRARGSSQSQESAGNERSDQSEQSRGGRTRGEEPGRTR